MSTLTTQDTFTPILESAPSNFLEQRLQGKDQYLTQGLPALKAEEYKFTLIRKKIEQTISDIRNAHVFDLDRDQVNQSIFPGFDGSVLVFTNGRLNLELSNYDENLSISKISDQQDLPLGSIAKAEKDPFVGLNQAGFPDGVFISVAKKVKIEKPVLLLSFNKSNEGQVIQPRVWIEAGDFAEASFIDHSVSMDDSPYFINKVVEIKGGVNSQLGYYRIQNEGAHAIEVSTLETDIREHSRFTSVNVSLSGDMVRNNLNLNLIGSNSEGNMYGLYLLNGKTHVDNHTNVDHTIPHAESNELYKGILADQSRGVFNGKIFVRQDAQKTNAFQQNNNILLSEDAVVNTKPQLEIWADDVKCSHGCTTGQLDEEALFYLRARGIDKTQAKGLLLYAFAGEVLEHIEEESFRDYCISLVSDRLGSKF
ncbi:Fe-S cluster assembly protein SufD [Algoriphagus sp.]|uniref:Fe-S cluster assembly protein SufD n=1 Tax=Algoriphagus sp. TaxID=1872435 RepID=UPI0026155BF0|nr:Fe-S cluster assembly protein SufD [Algoriphagus sp.]